MVQRGSVLPAGQSLPGEVEVRVLARILSPVSGLFTVTEKVMVTVPLAGTVPVQVRSGLAKLTEPAVAAGVVAVGGVVEHAGQRVGERRPGVRGLAGVGRP